MAKKKKKSWKKKLLKAALIGGALYGGSKLLGRGQGTASVNPVGGVDQIAADAASKVPFITKKVPEATTSRFDTRFTKDGIGPNELSGYSKRVRGVLPPSQLLTPQRTHVGRGVFNYKGGGIAKRGTGAAYKSGGRVTGIAKRGFGRALMKGKK